MDQSPDTGDAPRITPERIQAVIASEHYFTAEEGVIGAYKANGDVYVGTMPDDLNASALPLLTICVLVLANGFTVLGKSACASPENFNAEIGRRIAREDAERQIWALEGYLLRTTLALRSEFEQHDAMTGPVGALLTEFCGG
jgi:hypothetical protein